MMDRDERRAQRRLADTVASAALAASTSLLVVSANPTSHQRGGAPAGRGTFSRFPTQRSFQPTR
jgi:hypothetical protein